MHPAFLDVPRHAKQLTALSRMLEGNRLAHAFCFTGPDRLEKRDIAERLAAAALSISTSELTRHPDVIRLAQSEDGVKIDDVRDVCERLGHSAMLGTKVAILEDVHLLRHDAQNVLLKTLEEPSGRALIILLANDARAVLSTVLSRTTHLEFPQVALDALTAHVDLRADVLAFIALPKDQRLMRAGALVKGDTALDDETRDGWLALLAQELRQTYLPRGHSAPLRALLEARESLQAGGNPTLAFEQIALSID